MTGSERPAVVYEFDGFRLDPRRRVLTRDDGGAVALTARVFDALVYLVEHAGEVVSRDALTKALWPKTIVEDNNLNVTISQLRRALGDEGSPHRHVVTLAGRGYQFVTDVSAVRPSQSAVSDAPAHSPAATQPTVAAQRRRLGVWIGVCTLAVALLLAYVLVPEPSEAPAAAAAVQSVGTVSRVSRVTTYAGTERLPMLSPDATQVAFAWDGSATNPDIYVLRLGAQTPLRLTDDPAAEHTPTWSPDGSQIAFIRQHDNWRADIVVVPALGGAERKLQSVRVAPIVSVRWAANALAWTPDGKELLFTTQSDERGDVATGYEFRLLSLETGLVRPLIVSGDGYDASPAFSSDATRLAFARYDATTRDAQLMVQALGPGLTPLGDPQPVPGAWLGYPRSPVWSPDGARLFFIKNSQILEWHVDGGLRSVYATAGELAGFSLGWRGSKPIAVAAVYDDQFDIWAVALDPATRNVIGSPVRRVYSTARDWHPRYSPDGRRVAFISWRNGAPDLWLTDADGKSPRQLSSVGASDPGVPRWSPDGSQISFTAFTPNDEPHTYLVDVDEGLPRLVTRGATSGWSPDGRYLYMTELTGVPNVVRYRLADGLREILVESAAAAQESADGRRLLYTKLNEVGIFARSLDGDVANNPDELLVDDYWLPPSFGFAPVAGGFYYVGYTPDGRARALRFYDDSARSARDLMLMSPNTTPVFGLSVAPDGSELLFGAPESGADIVLLEF